MYHPLLLCLALASLTACSPALHYRQRQSDPVARSPQGAVTFVTGSRSPLPARAPERASRPTELIVTTGSLSHPYEALGKVYVSTAEAIPREALLRNTYFHPPLARAFAVSPVTPTLGLIDKLRWQAQELYGSKVDAVINVTYRHHAGGHLLASGLAVRLVDPQPPRTAEERLQQLTDLWLKGLLSLEEYRQKRREILGGL